jgi:hypothetical protein
MHVTISNIIKLKRLQWVDHIQHMDEKTYRKGFWKATLLERGLMQWKWTVARF